MPPETEFQLPALDRWNTINRGDQVFLLRHFIKQHPTAGELGTPKSTMQKMLQSRRVTLDALIEQGVMELGNSGEFARQWLDTHDAQIKDFQSRLVDAHADITHDDRRLMAIHDKCVAEAGKDEKSQHIHVRPVRDILQFLRSLEN